MANKKSWYDLLKDPRWQKKRLEVMELAGFGCEDCGAEDKTLHIHHSYYEKDVPPWEYPTNTLHCLCEECHKDAQNIQKLLKRQIGMVDLSDMPRLLGYAYSLEASSYPDTVIDVFSYEMAEGVGAAWGLTAKEVIDNLVEGKIDGWKLNELSMAKHSKKKILDA